MDESFISWYHTLNGEKEIKRFDFKSETIKEDLQELISSCDVILNGLPEKISKSLGIDLDTVKEKSLVYCRPLSSKSYKKPMHDVNALAMCGLLPMHVDNHFENDFIDPPMLPIAGISFGQQMALKILAGLIKAKDGKKTIEIDAYLDDATKVALTPFYPENLQRDGKTKFLHNGKFPCYCIYKSSDNRFIALAAVEEKFWINFCELFKIEIENEKRFHYEDNSIFNQLANLFKTMNSVEIEKLAETKDCCLTIF